LTAFEFCSPVALAYAMAALSGIKSTAPAWLLTVSIVPLAALNLSCKEIVEKQGIL
jgi:hypothetical protein